MKGKCLIIRNSQNSDSIMFNNRIFKLRRPGISRMIFSDAVLQFVKAGQGRIIFDGSEYETCTFVQPIYSAFNVTALGGANQVRFHWETAEPQNKKQVRWRNYTAGNPWSYTGEYDTSGTVHEIQVYIGYYGSAKGIAWKWECRNLNCGQWGNWSITKTFITFNGEIVYQD